MAIFGLMYANANIILSSRLAQGLIAKKFSVFITKNISIKYVYVYIEIKSVFHTIENKKMQN